MVGRGSTRDTIIDNTTLALVIFCLIPQTFLWVSHESIVEVRIEVRHAECKHSKVRSGSVGITFVIIMFT